VGEEQRARSKERELGAGSKENFGLRIANCELPIRCLALGFRSWILVQRARKCFPRPLRERVRVRASEENSYCGLRIADLSRAEGVRSGEASNAR
jgi:hypothetical protein